MPQFRQFTFVTAALLLCHAVAQQTCINTCTDSANVLTQLKSCSGCGTDDWACFCRCQQYMNAIVSCVQQNCNGQDIENSIVSFCSTQGVPISLSSGSVSIGSSTLTSSSRTSSGTSATGSATSSSNTGSATGTNTANTSGTTVGGGGFLSTAAAGSSSSSASSTSSTSSGSYDTSRSSLTGTQSSDISSYLATVIPASARTQSSDACFVNTQYNYYSTPIWYSSLPTQAQSYYSSVNQGNTAACTLSPSAAAALAKSQSGHHGLSAGAIAGIVVGSVIAALLLLILLLLCCRRRSRSRRDAAAMRAKNYQPRNMPPETYGDEKGYVGGAVPVTNGRGPYKNEKALAGAAVPGHGRHHNDRNGLAAAALPGHENHSHHNGLHGHNGVIGAAPLPGHGGHAHHNGLNDRNALAAAAIPSHGGHANHNGLNGHNGVVGTAPLVNGRTTQTPYESGLQRNRGLNGVAAVPNTTTGVHAPYSGNGVHGPNGGVGGAALGAGGPKPDFSYTTTTTTRSILRPKKKTGPISSNLPTHVPTQSTQPLQQPVPSYTPVEHNLPQTTASNSMGRRAF